MKHFLPFFILSASLLPLRGHAQLTNGGINANFGVDADTRANWVKYGPTTGTILSDDWWAPLGFGNNVIDTTGASGFLALLQSGKNISFNRRMSALLYAKIGGRLWLDAAYGRDYIAASAAKDSTTFTIASKNGDDPSNWRGGFSNFPNKNDLTDVYAHMRRDGLTVHDSLWLFTGVSTYGTTGSSYFDVELYKNNFSYDGTTGLFTTAGTNAGHTQWIFDGAGNITQTGDLIIAVNFSPGLVPVVDVRIWVSQSTVSTVIPAYFNFTGSFDGASASPAFGYASIVSKTGTTAWGSGISNYSATATQDTTYATPWGTGSPAGPNRWFPLYQTQQLIEVGLNLTRIGVDPALYSALSPCQSLFSNIFFKSRSSNSFTSNMQDFVYPLVFLRNPVMDYSLQPDTIRCNHPTGNITLTNNSTAGHYTWTTLSGDVVGANSDSSQLSIDKPGTYIVNASPADGCPPTRTDTIVIPIDTFPPVATAFVGMTGHDLALYGGDPVASNYPTPFGGSAGLTFTWTGPNSFSSTAQNPVTDTAWGTYQVTVTEQRNGCTAVASTTADRNMFITLLTNDLLLSGLYNAPSVNLHWQDLNETAVQSYTLERMDNQHVFRSLATLPAGGPTIGDHTATDPAAGLTTTGQTSAGWRYTDDHPLPGINAYRIKAITHSGVVYYSAVITVATSANGAQTIYLAGGPGDDRRLMANMAAEGRGTVVIYTAAGQLLQKRNVYLVKGNNTIALPLATGGQPTMRVVALFLDGRVVFSQTGVF